VKTEVGRIMTVTEKELVNNFKTLSPESRKIALEFVVKLKNEETKTPKRLGILQKIDDIVNSKPKNIWDEVPKDSSENVDFYLYGAEKRK
jgi:hypothetical protein